MGHNVGDCTEKLHFWKGFQTGKGDKKTACGEGGPGRGGLAGLTAGGRRSIFSILIISQVKVFVKGGLKNKAKIKEAKQTYKTIPILYLRFVLTVPSCENFVCMTGPTVDTLLAPLAVSDLRIQQLVERLLDCAASHRVQMRMDLGRVNFDHAIQVFSRFRRCLFQLHDKSSNLVILVSVYTPLSTRLRTFLLGPIIMCA